MSRIQFEWNIGLAAGDRQGMKSRDRPLRILLEVVEEWRLVTRRDALEDGQVEFHRLLDRMEDAAQTGGLGIAGDRLHVAAREHVQVELRPRALDDARQLESRRPGSDAGSHLPEEFANDGRIVPGLKRHAVCHHHRRHARVQHDGADGVLEGTDEDRLVDELVFLAAEPAHLVGERLPPRGFLGGDEEHFEVRAMRLARRHHARDDAGRHGVLFRLPLFHEVGPTPDDEHFGDMAGEPRRLLRIAGFNQGAQSLDCWSTGNGVELFHHRQFVDEAEQLRRLRPAGHPIAGKVGNHLPPVIAHGVKGKELVDAGALACSWSSPFIFCVTPPCRRTGDLFWFPPNSSSARSSYLECRPPFHPAGITH